MTEQTPAAPPAVWWSPTEKRFFAELWGAILAGVWREAGTTLPADAVRLVPDAGPTSARATCALCTSRGAPVCCCERSSPDTGQAHEVLKLRWEVQQLQGVVQDQHRAIAAVRSLCADAMKLPTLEDPRPADDRVSPRAVLAALDRAGPSPVTVQAPDVAEVRANEWRQRFRAAAAAANADGFHAVAAHLSELSELVRLPGRVEAIARALLGTDTTPEETRDA